MFIYDCYLIHAGAFRKIRYKFDEKYGRSITRKTVGRIVDKLRHTHTLHDAPKSGRPRSSCSEPSLERVKDVFEEEPTISIRRASSQMDLPRSSLHRSLKQLKLKPWRPRRVQALKDDDNEARLKFCRWFVRECEKNPNFQDRIVWTDESSFKINGRMNRQNSVYWAKENPHITEAVELNVPGLMFWGGISSAGIVGPYLFEESVNGENYLELLQGDAVSAIPRNKLFMQDGAPAHFAIEVREFLDKRFNRWIGRSGTVAWPPRSPDLTPCDFSLWGLMKDDLRSQQFEDNHQLEDAIRQKFSEINNDKDLCRRICRSVLDRCRMCITANGGHFEHLM